MRKPDPTHKRNANLTAAESEILELAGTLTIDEIAKRLNLSYSTVRNRIFQAREKKRDLENLKVAGVEYGGRWT